LRAAQDLDAVGLAGVGGDLVVARREAREMKEQGSFGWMAQAMPAGELRRMFT